MSLVKMLDSMDDDLAKHRAKGGKKSAPPVKEAKEPKDDADDCPACGGSGKKKK